MGFANRFWKLMGSTQGRDTSRAQTAVEASHGFDDWAGALADDEFADAAHGLKLFGVLPHSEAVYRCDCDGEPSAKLPDNDPMKTALKGIMQSIGL